MPDVWRNWMHVLTRKRATTTPSMLPTMMYTSLAVISIPVGVGGRVVVGASVEFVAVLVVVVALDEVVDVVVVGVVVVVVGVVVVVVAVVVDAVVTDVSQGAIASSSTSPVSAQREKCMVSTERLKLRVK